MNLLVFSEVGTDWSFNFDWRNFHFNTL